MSGIAIFVLLTRVFSRSIVPKRGMLTALVVFLFGLLVSIAGNSFFSYMVKKNFGNPPVYVPLLTPRMIEDGPGYLLIKEHCPEIGFEVCKYSDYLPLSSKEFWWDAKVGVYLNADPESRRKMSLEDKRFALRVISTYPMRQSAASLRNSIRQFFNFGVNEFNYGRESRRRFSVKIPDGRFAQMKSTMSFRNLWPITIINFLHYLVVISSFIFLIWCYFFWRKNISNNNDIIRDEGGIAVDRELWFFCAIIAVGIIVNAVVCGAASEVQSRYQARVIWLVPLAATIVGLRFRDFLPWDARPRK
jgi:hypothetical protein